MSDFIYGKNTVRNAIKSNNTIKKLIVSDTFKDEEILSLARKKNLKIEKRNSRDFYNLVGNVIHQGIVAEVEEYHYYTLEELISKIGDKENPTIAILDGLEDPHNLGAILRSADALGIDGLIISKNGSVQVNGTVAKVSTGAYQYVPVAMVSNLNNTIQKLKDLGYWVVCSDGSGHDDYRQIDYKMKTVLVVGSEGFGASKLVIKNSDFVVKIPMCGHVNSLNASVAAALLFMEVYNQKNPVEKKYGSKR